MARIIRVQCKEGNEQTLVCKFKECGHAFTRKVVVGDNKSLVDATGKEDAHWKNGMPHLSKTCGGHSKLFLCRPEQYDDVLKTAVKAVEGTDPL